MDVVYILLFIQGITGRMVLYQPQNIVSVDVDGTALITCVSTENSIGLMFYWYFKKQGSTRIGASLKSCVHDNDTHKYTCKHDGNMASLEIYDVQITDSGVYYCRYKHITQIFGNGTHLNVGDKSTSRSSIHILGHPQPIQHLHGSLQLACVVLAAHNTVHIHWNISGTYHRGGIISKEESEGMWTVVNMISLLKDNWNQEENVTCEAWLGSSPTSVHWEIPRKAELHHEYFTSKCQNFLIPVVTSGIFLLMMFFVHFIRICLKNTDNETLGSIGKNNVTEDEITYSELNINYITRFRTQTEQ